MKKINLDLIVDKFFRKLKQLDGVEITYRRGEKSVQIIAIRDAVNMENVNSDRFGVNRQTMAFSFAVEELKWSDGLPFIPALGDRIDYNNERFELILYDSGRAFEVEEVGRRIITVIGQKI